MKKPSPQTPFILSVLRLGATGALREAGLASRSVAPIAPPKQEVS
jgi:hypothetical protein